VKYLLTILLASCAVPDRINHGITGPHGDSPSMAAMCLYSTGARLPEAPFHGVTVEFSDQIGTAYNYRDSIVAPTGSSERVLAHEFVHVALTRYAPHVANHHQWMEQNGTCFGGCVSIPTGRYNKGCE
jgi:hypothetical protein